jgi:hypothetical protein
MLHSGNVDDDLNARQTRSLQVNRDLCELQCFLRAPRLAAA